MEAVSIRIDTLLELPHHEVDSDDCEDEPEDDADRQHVGYAGKSANKGRDYNLRTTAKVISKKKTTVISRPAFIKANSIILFKNS